MTGLQRLLDALSASGVTIRSARTEQNVNCPAHEDKTASLSVGQGQKGAVVHCHAGCATDAVLNGIGLKPADLFDKPAGGGREIVATYDYTDEAGLLLFQSVRYQPKDFRHGSSARLRKRFW